jgi:hypothetical protein
MLSGMKRRTLVKYLALPALMAVGAAGYARARPGENPYYQGPRSDHFDGLRFFTPGQPPDKGFLELMRWQFGGGRESWPEAFPSPFSDRPPARVEGLRVVLVGHASVLIQVTGLNILIDPVFAERASPVSFMGPKRVNPPGIAFDDLPPIDAVLSRTTITTTWTRVRSPAVGAVPPPDRGPLRNDAIIKAADPEFRWSRRTGTRP